MFRKYPILTSIIVIALFNLVIQLFVAVDGGGVYADGFTLLLFLKQWAIWTGCWCVIAFIILSIFAQS